VSEVAKKSVISSSGALAKHEDPHFSSIVREVSDIVSKLAGIQLGEKQFSMVENRLRSRMIKIGLKTPQEYLSYLKTHQDAESQALVSLLTTHHTFFFREFTHFEFLQMTALKQIISAVRARGEKKIKIWSAACSRGQEVYSIAMFFKFYLPQMAPDLDFEIFGSDVDAESVGIAKNGVYHHREIKEIPLSFMGDHWVRGKGEIADFAKVKAGLRSHVNFDVVNLLKPSPVMAGKKFDIIFCRNVFIYFSPDQIKSVVNMFMEKLHAESYLFVGVSETLSGLNLPLNYIGPSVYALANAKKESQPLTVVKGDSKNTKLGTAVLKQPSVVTPAPAAPQVLRVLCVDDSPSILTLLKRTLVKEDGFEVVATATNGKEAADVLNHQKVDVITLDIHMPEMDGITYLKTHFNKSHPPVVMLSTVNRENADMALKALELGASDYIEKPNLANLAERGDEIKAKLKAAVFNKSLAQTSNLQVDKEFLKKIEIKNPENKIRVIVGGLGQKKHLNHIIKQVGPKDPPTLVFTSGVAEAMQVFVTDIEKTTGRKMHVIKQATEAAKAGEVYFIDGAESTWTQLQSMKKQLSVFIMGIPSQMISKSVLSLSSVHLVLEDLGPNARHQQKTLLEVASTTTPYTSYISVSEEFWGGL
jgi:chemotaxis protein methyltransferase CheR